MVRQWPDEQRGLQKRNLDSSETEVGEHSVCFEIQEFSLEWIFLNEFFPAQNRGWSFVNASLPAEYFGLRVNHPEIHAVLQVISCMEVASNPCAENKSSAAARISCFVLPFSAI